ncbi:contact-dependent growth inhibition system immunity protein [Falsirhodobacter xinxiangensis]|uniref:contact-dependent growth inhibition system immunity protein n=1 Tax=Falsirhodobacter xinxiangensis TaxID=2530049 RepID=UPI0010AA24D1|nr:contact-dependent growth inhibition system immunity protein [Rhodobacter xinxiangensis]
MKRLFDALFRKKLPAPKVLSPAEFGAMMRAEAAARPKPPPPPERKEAGVVAFRTFTHIYSHAVYRMCVPDPTGYDELLAADLAPEPLGRAAREALAASRFITPQHPERDSIMRFPTKEEAAAADQRLKSHAKVRSLKALFDGAGMVSLRLMDGRIAITPLCYRTRGAWEGFAGNGAIDVGADVADNELGAAIAKAIAISREAKRPPKGP